MHVLNPLVRRRSWLLALATLTALLALAAVALAQQARAQTISDVSLSLSLQEESDNIVPANNSAITVLLSASYVGDTDVTFNLYNVVLRVSGSLEWDINGRSSLRLIEDVTNNGADGNALEVGPLTNTEITHTELAAANRVVCGDSTLDGDRTVRCALNAGFLGDDEDADPDAYKSGTGSSAVDIERPADPLVAMNALDLDAVNEADTRITIPSGTANGTKFTISVSAKIRTGATDADGDRTITANLPVEVGEVDEVATATLTLGQYRPDPEESATRAFPATITHNQAAVSSVGSQSGETALMLRILNGGGKASAANSVASVLVTSSSGTLRASANVGGCTGDTAGLACQIDQNRINASNADKIFIYVKHPGSGKSGKASVTARVLSTSGTSIATDPVEITFAGPLDKLTISEPTGGVLNVGTDDDTRDQLTLSVKGEDKSGNKVTVPSASGTPNVKGPGSNANVSGVSICWPLRPDCSASVTTGTGGTNNAQTDKDGNPQVRVTVERESNNKLAAGEYTLNIRAGSKNAQQKFTVSGDPDSVVLGEPEGDLNINGRITIEATVNDAEGNAVPDGTTITFNAQQAGTVPVLVQVSASASTKAGKATGTYLVVGTGTGWITAASGGKSGIKLVNIGAVEQAPTDLSDCLSITTPNTFATWKSECAPTSTASAVLASLNGVSSILLWQNNTWLRYGVVDGQVIPGSYDFEINGRSIMWLGR